jgi:PBP1b-binding outer membrane lipoprotein LpoB
MNTAAVLRFHLMLVLVALVAAGCGTSVKRVDTEKVKDLSGAWNDTDSRLVSEEMIEDVLSQPWLREYTRKNRAQPALIVGDMRNLSHEHINMNTFVADKKTRTCMQLRRRAIRWARNWGPILCFKEPSIRSSMSQAPSRYATIRSI